MKQTEILEKLKSLEDWELIEIWNEFCDINRWHEDMIYLNDEEFFEIFYSGGDLMSLVKNIVFGDYEFYHAWVKFARDENLETTDYLWDFIDFGELTKWIEENEIEIGE